MRLLVLNSFVLCGLLVPSAGFAQQKDRERVMERPARMAPAPRAQRMAAPNVVKKGKYVSTQVNVTALQMNIVGDAANEPSLAIDPTNPSHLAVGWRQFDSVASDFRQSGYAWSSDGGKTWNAGTLNAGTFGSDPVLAVDGDGRFYYSGLGFDAYDNFQFYTYISPLGSYSWSAPWTALGGDKQWLVADNTSGPGRGLLHMAWSAYYSSYGTQTYTRSIDGGNSIETPLDLPGQPTFGTVAVDASGRVFVGGTAPFSPGFWVTRSSDAQNPLATPTFDISTPVSLNGEIVFGLALNPAGLGGQAWICADAGTGPFRNYVYLLCTTQQYDSADPADIMITRSIDGGATWGSPFKVNKETAGLNAYQWFGTLSVAPNGRLDAFWYDTRYDATPATPATSTLVYSFSVDAGQSWSPQVQISPAFRNNSGYPVQQKMGDYIQAVSSNTGVGLAYAATFNKGEQDIWYTFVPNTLGPSTF